MLYFVSYLQSVPYQFVISAYNPLTKNITANITMQFFIKLNRRGYLLILFNILQYLKSSLFNIF